MIKISFLYYEWIEIRTSNTLLDFMRDIKERTFCFLKESINNESSSYGNRELDSIEIHHSFYNESVV